MRPAIRDLALIFLCFHQPFLALAAIQDSGSLSGNAAEQTVTVNLICRRPGPVVQYNPMSFAPSPDYPGFLPEQTICDPDFPPDFGVDKGLFSPLDRGQVFSLGVDPATLVPEGIDLELFPNFPLSEELSLKPSLSYSSDSTLTRRGLLSYGPPKRWRNHYGELVRLIPRQDRSHFAALGFLKENADDGDNPSESGERQGLAVEIQTYFVNATGQEVNFFPDPADPHTYYSDSGNYRLQFLSAAEGFELKTPDGLAFRFEKYKYFADFSKEALSLHYKVTRISDRFGNYIRVVYRGEAPSGLGDPSASLQPEHVIGFREDGSRLQELVYLYDDRDRLSELRTPKLRSLDPEAPVTAMDAQLTDPGSYLSYRFYYPDQLLNNQPLHPSGQAGWAQRVDGQHAKLLSLTPARTAWLTNDFVYIDLYGEELGPLAGILNLDSLETAAGPASGAYYLKVEPEGGGTPSYYSFNENRYNFRHGFGTNTLRYRYQLDPYSGDYAAGVDPEAYPDRIRVTKLSGPTFTGKVKLYLLPAIKPGDLLVDEQGQTLMTFAQGPVLNPEKIPVPGPNLPTSPMAVLRQDNLKRIAAIDFPASGSGAHTRKRLLITYDDRSLNHAEIGKVAVYDQGVLIRETSYDYEQIRTTGTSEDVHQITRGYDGATALGLCDQLTQFFRTDPGAARALGDVYVGLNAYGREQPVTLLRRKTETYAETYGGPLTQSLTTHYGGAYQFVLAGQKAEIEANPAAPDACRRVQWGLDGKPFRFTWQILPDGGGRLFDLSPVGLGLDPWLAHANRRSRVFKTYSFDSAFQTSMETRFPAYTGRTPFFMFLPTYPDASANPTPLISQVAASPEAYANPYGLVIPRLAPLFDGSFPSKAYEAQVTALEPVLKFPYAPGTTYLPRETLKAVHGSAKFSTTSPSITRWSQVRSSGIRSLIEGSAYACATGLPVSLDLGQVEAFLAGDLCTRVVLDPAQNPEAVAMDEVIPWSRSDLSFVEPHEQGDLGDRTRPYDNLQKLMPLQPHFSYQARNLEGFQWDAAKGHPRIEARHFVNGTRFSNGGALGVTIPEQTYLPAVASISQIQVAALPDRVAVGDLFRHDQIYYRLTQIIGQNVSFQPNLRTSLFRDHSTLGTSDLRFFRYAQPATGLYRGYDAFGNNGYRESYHGAASVVFSTAEDQGLVPDFGHAGTGPQTIAVNDSTDPTNNDILTWSYFGRISNRYTRTARPFYRFQNGSGSWIDAGQAMAYSFHVSLLYQDGDVPWKPTRQTVFYLPVKGLVPVSSDGGDVITDFQYHADTAANAPYQGRVYRSKTYKRGQELLTFSLNETRYDALGRPAVETAATFLNGATPYVRQTRYVRDGNTGLPLQEEVTIAAGSLTPPSNNSPWGVVGNRQRTDFRAYDLLGRATRSYQRDGNDGAFGPETLIRYENALWTVTESRIPGGDLLAATSAYRNGSDQNVLSLTRQGGSLAGAWSEPVFAIAWQYDQAGRLIRSYVETKTDLTEPEYDLSGGLADLFSQKGFSQQVYNPRGQVWGSVVYRDPAAAIASQWILWEQDPADAALLTTHGFSQLESEGLNQTGIGRLQIKSQTSDKFGNLNRVIDREISSGVPATLFTENQPPAYTVADLTLPNPLTKGVYAYDFQDRVVAATVGTAAVQERAFQFDQRGRLRLEHHPEMAIDVGYANFDHNDNPTEILSGNRTTQFTFDAYGNALQVQYTDADNGLNRSMSTIYDYQVQPATTRFPDLPRFTKIQAPENKEIGYRFLYDPLRGWLTSRELIHNLDADFPGYAAAVTPTATVTTLPSMILSYRVHDVLGRPEGLTYPSAEAGGGFELQPDLTYSYANHLGQETGLLRSIRDEGLDGQAPPLVERLGYGPGLVMEALDFNPAGFRIERRRDTLNRIASMTFELGSSPQHQRAYDYDFGQRIKRITTPTGTFFYGYDSLGQIIAADIKSDLFDFQYDNFGNLIGRDAPGSAGDFQVSGPLPDNRFPQFAYNPHGELIGRTLNPNPAWVYGPNGRLEQFQEGDVVENYAYDPFGLRVFVRREQPETQTRLYFYDEGHQVICEWIREAGGQPRWDRSYLYQEGQTLITYEWDKLLASGENPARAGIPGRQAPKLFIDLVEPERDRVIIRWGRGPGALGYDLEIVRMEQGRRIPLKGVQKTTETHQQPQLPPGAYQARVSVSDGAPGQWLNFQIPEPSPFHFGFDQDLQGWLPNSHITQVQVGDGFLHAQSSAANPNLVSPSLSTAGNSLPGSLMPTVRIRMKTDAGTLGQLFWRTETAGFSFERVVSFNLIADGLFHTYQLDMAGHTQWQGQGITVLRLDPVDVGGADFSIDYIQSLP